MTSAATIAPGVIATAEFVGDPGSKVFAVRTAPVGGATRRLIVCPPFGGEAPRNYRREVDLGRSLAQQDVETIRFHYRGTGHSDPVEDFGFASMVEDAHTISHANDEITDTTWMGTRLGGVVAVTVARGSMVLWDPVIDPNAHFREILRASVFSAFKSDDPGTAPKTDLIKHLESEGEIDLLGYRLADRFRQQVCSAPTLKSLDVSGRKILMIDIRRRGTPRNETNRLAEVWRSGGAHVTVDAVALNEPWWYGARAGSSAAESSEGNQRLVTLTTEFVTDLERVAP